MKKGWPNKFKALKSWLWQKMLRNAGFEVLPFWTMFKFLGSLLAPVPNLSSLGVYYKARRIAGSAASTCSQSCARAADANATPMSVGIRWIHAANAAIGYVYVDVACHAASAVPRVDLACDAPSPTTASPRPSCLHGGVCCGWTHSAGTPRIDTRTSRGGAEGSCTGFAIWGLKRARCVGVIHWLSVSIRVTLLQHSSVAIATCTWFEVLNWPRVQWTARSKFDVTFSDMFHDSMFLSRRHIHDRYSAFCQSNPRQHSPSAVHATIDCLWYRHVISIPQRRSAKCYLTSKSSCFGIKWKMCAECSKSDWDSWFACAWFAWLSKGVARCFVFPQAQLQLGSIDVRHWITPTEQLSKSFT